MSKSLEKKIENSWLVLLNSYVKRKPDPRISKDPSLLNVRRLALSYDGEIHDLWQKYIGAGREQVGKSLLSSSKQSNAYLLSFHYPNLIKMLKLLERIKFADLIKDSNELVVIEDIGCGTGALATGTLGYLYENNISVAECHLIDSVRNCLSIASSALEELRNELNRQDQFKIVSRRCDAATYRANQQLETNNILLMGYFWNELVKNNAAAENLYSIFEKRVTSKQWLFMLEPANEKYSKELWDVRDRLIGMGYKMVAPCPHSKACPMLDTKKDWCFSEFKWDMPQNYGHVDAVSGLDHSVLTSNALVFASPSALAEMKKNSNKKIVVGRPKLDNMTYKYLLCSPCGSLKSSGPQKYAETNLLRGEEK